VEQTTAGSQQVISYETWLRRHRHPAGLGLLDQYVAEMRLLTQDASSAASSVALPRGVGAPGDHAVPGDFISDRPRLAGPLITVPKQLPRDP